MGVCGFCPELTYDIFDLFAGEISRFIDENAKQGQRLLLKDEEADENDPRWDWQLVHPKHYLDCIEFSVYGKDTPRKTSRTRKKRENISDTIRWKVFERDSFTCVYCGAKAGEESPLHLDHKKSLADGGSNEISNLVTACKRCNIGKGARSIS